MTIQDGKNQVERSYQLFQDASHLINRAITEAFLFSWQWWLGIGLFIIPWIVWIVVRRRESTARLLSAGMISVILGIIIDIISTSMGKWSYPIKFIPNTLGMFLPYHFSLLPVGVMLTLQFKPNWNPVWKGAIFAGLGAFIVMRFFEWIGFYNSKGWPAVYDFVILLFIFLVSYSVSKINGYEKLRTAGKSEYKYNFQFLRRKQKIR